MKKYKEKYSACGWSDNWWIENDKSWFVDGTYNRICCVNLKTAECEFVAKIPETSFRLTPKCIKCKDNIFCMPDYGNNIWVYNIINHNFSKIIINNSDKVRLRLYDFWQYENKIFAVSIGLRQIIEIDIINQKIDKYYDICKEGSISQSLRYENYIYTLSDMKNEIYQFNMDTKEKKVYILPNIERKFYSFCFDGEKFWISGYYKEIYVWDKEKNTIKILYDFPEKFGIYNFTKDTDGNVDCIADRYEVPTFWYSLAVGDKVWFIPFQTNQIIYVDKETYEIRSLKIDEEIETKESILSRTSLWYKYTLEYITDNRYIGLFSLKNNCIVEIDTINEKTVKKQYIFNNKGINELLNIYKEFYKEYFKENIFRENDVLGQKIFALELLKGSVEVNNKAVENIGKKIYQAVERIT